MNSGLAIRIRPRHLAVSVDFQGAVGQLKAKIQKRAGSLWLGGKYIHTRFAQVEEDSLNAASVGKRECHGSLHRHTICATPFAIEQGSHSAQACPGFIVGERLVEYEIG